MFPLKQLRDALIKKQNLDWRNAFFIFQIAKILFQWSINYYFG
jgi:hypothetical protein